MLVSNVPALCLLCRQTTLQSGHFCGHALHFAQHGGGQLFDLAFVVGAVAHDVCMGVVLRMSGGVDVPLIQVNISPQHLVPGHRFIRFAPLPDDLNLMFWRHIR